MGQRDRTSERGQRNIATRHAIAFAAVDNPGDTTDVAALRVEQVALGERKDKAAAMFFDGTIDEVQLATITKRADERAKEIAEVLAKAGWRSPLEPLTGGNIEAVWKQLTLAQNRAILDAVADVTVLPTKATRNRRGFDPDSVRINWKVS
jgi:site-specific DNA recombinase